MAVPEPHAHGAGNVHDNNNHLWVSNSLLGRFWELNEPSAMGHPSAPGPVLNL